MPEQVLEIEISKLAPSPFNPRRQFPAAELADLAASIAAQGVQSPLVVRSIVANGLTHQIVFGERRFRAAQRAGIKTVPCIVRALTDEEARTAQIIENLQRADIGPLEEAQAYRDLLKLEGQALQAAGGDEHKKASVAKLAGAIGKSKEYVYHRLQLLKLGEPARAALAKGEISASVAQEIAPLDEKKQAKALRSIENYGLENAPVSAVREHLRYELKDKPKPSQAETAERKKWAAEEKAREARYAAERQKAAEQQEFEKALLERVLAALWPKLEAATKGFSTPAKYRPLVALAIEALLGHGSGEVALRRAQLNRKQFAKAPEAKRLAVALFGVACSPWNHRERALVAQLAGLDVRPLEKQLRDELAKPKGPEKQAGPAKRAEKSTGAGKAPRKKARADVGKAARLEALRRACERAAKASVAAARSNEKSKARRADVGKAARRAKRAR